MRIQAGGRTWRVEERDHPGDAVAGEHFCDLSFHDEDAEDEVVQIRWVVRPPRWNARMARALFDLAGERLWRDPRDGTLQRVRLESLPEGPAEEDSPDRPLHVSFASRNDTVHTDYDADLPLGTLGDPELERLLDRARTRSGTIRGLGPTH